MHTRSSLLRSLSLRHSRSLARSQLAEPLHALRLAPQQVQRAPTTRPATPTPHATTPHHCSRTGPTHCETVLGCGAPHSPSHVLPPRLSSPVAVPPDLEDSCKMAQKQPVKLQELVKLGAAGIKPEDLNFKSVTMDSGACLQHLPVPCSVTSPTPGGPTCPADSLRVPCLFRRVHLHPRNGGKIGRDHRHRQSKQHAAHACTSRALVRTAPELPSATEPTSASAQSPG